MASLAQFARLRHAHMRIGALARAIAGPRLLSLLAVCLGLVLVGARVVGAAAVVLLVTASTAAALRAIARGGRGAGDHGALAGEVRRWRSLVAVADQAIVMVTRTGLVTSWNPAAERMYGWRAHEIAGRSLLEVVAEARRAEVAAKLEPRSAGDGAVSFATVGLHRDGTRVDVVMSIVPFCDARGRCVAVGVLTRDIGETKALQEAVRRLERDYDELVEHDDDGVFLADHDGRLVGVNRAGCRLLGVSREELLGRSLAAVMPDDEARRLASVRAALVAGEPHVGEWLLRKRDGSWMTAEVRMVLLGDGRVQSFVRDLSQQTAKHAELVHAHATERKVRVQLQTLSEATSAITDAVARIPQTDVDAVLMVIVLQAQTLTNARYAALGLGTDPSRPFERWVYAGMTAEQAAAIGRGPRPVGLLGAVAQQARIIRLRDMNDSEERIGFPPGHPPMHSFLGVPILYEGRSRGNLYLADKLDGAEFTADDQQAIEVLAARAGTALETARVYHEETLATTWLRSAIDGIPEAVILTDANGRVSLNAAARELVQLAREEEVNLDVLSRLTLYEATGEPLPSAALPLTRALREGVTTIGMECMGRNKKLQQVPLLASASPLRGAKGESMGAVCVLRDISSIKEIERLREQWTAIIAHELRQPVQMISACARTIERARRTELDPLGAKSVGRILGAAARLERMIKDLLDVARIEARQLALHRESVDLGALITEVVGRFAHTTERVIHLDLPEQLPPVHADPGRIEQILENLLSNALKYGEPGTPITVDVQRRERELLVSTTNQGHQLAPAEVDCLFKRFYRSRLVESIEGLGLGLYIAHGLVEAHGGQIWAESCEASTSFRFTLPIEQAARA